MHQFIRILILISLLLAWPIDGSLQTELSPESDARLEITHQLDEIYNLSLTGGTANELTSRQLSYFSSLPTIIPPGETPIIGLEAVSEFYTQVFSTVVIVENSYDKLTIEVGGDTAVRRYVGTGTIRVLADSETIATKVEIIDILIKEDGEWKTLVHSWRMSME